MARNVRIVMTNHGEGEVFLDGVQLEGVYAASLQVAAKGQNVVTLELRPQRVTVEGPFEVNEMTPDGS